MFGALKRGRFRSLASLSYTCSECCWRTSTEKNTCGITRFPCGSTAFLYIYTCILARSGRWLKLVFILWIIVCVHLTQSHDVPEDEAVRIFLEFERLESAIKGVDTLVPFKI